MCISAERAWVLLCTPEVLGRGGEDAVFVRKGRGPRARGHVELGEDVRDVAGDRLLADEEGAGDVSIALARGHQPEDLDLAGGESTGRRRRGGAGVGVSGAEEQDFEVALRAEALE